MLSIFNGFNFEKGRAIELLLYLQIFVCHYLRKQTKYRIVTCCEWQGEKWSHERMVTILNRVVRKSLTGQLAFSLDMKVSETFQKERTASAKAVKWWMS